MNKIKSKAKMFSRIFMAILLASSGVAISLALAISSTTIKLGGGISFTADGVHALIKGNVEGTKTTNTLDDILIDAYTAENFESPNSWQKMTLDFQNSSHSIDIIVSIENLGKQSLWLSFADKIDSTGLSITRKTGISSKTDDLPAVEKFSVTKVEINTTQYLSITLKVDNKGQSITNGSFDFEIKLTSSEPAQDATDYPSISFNSNDDGTLSVTKSSSVGSDIVIPSKVLIDGVEYQVTSIADNAFSMCFGLRTVTISSGITSIGNNSFGYTGVTSITIPAGITSIGDNAFSNCTNLGEINLPDSLKSIGFQAFVGCYSLKSITIPANVTSIGESAFSQCSEL